MTNKAILYATIATTMLGAGVANAQTGPQAAGAPTASVLGEVVVTARRREENQQSVPVAITALGSEALKARNVQDIGGLQTVVPNLNLGSSTSTGGRKAISPAIRGVRSAAVTIYFAEVARTGGPGNGSNLGAAAIADAFYDLASVEVLKGPQGTLFGSNSTAGALVVRPQRPQHVFEGSIEGRLGNYNMKGGTGVLNIPIIEEKVALRIAADFEDRGGFQKGKTRDYDDDDHYSYRASLLLEPTEGISNVTVLDYYNLDSNAGATTAIGFTPCPTPAVGSGPCLFRAPNTTTLGVLDYVATFNSEQANGLRRTDQDAPLFQRVFSTAVSNITEVKLGEPAGFLGEVSFRAILGYTNYKSKTLEDADGLRITNITQRVSNRTRRRSQEFQVLGDNGRFNWVAGFYASQGLMVNLVTAQSLAPISASNPTITQTVPEREKTLAGYVQATLEVVENLRLTGGYRYTRTEVDNTLTSRGGPLGACTLGAGPGVNLTACQRVSELNSNDPSYTFSVDYKLDEDTLIYATTRRGFNRGGFNAQGVTAESAAFSGEKLTDYELGLKRDWRFDTVEVRTNVAVFRNKYDNIQRRINQNYCVGGATNYLPIAGGCPNGGSIRPTSVFINAAKATIDGVEVEAIIVPTDGLRISLAGSYLDAGYDSFPLTNGATVLDLSGNVLSQAPKWAYVASLDYTFPETGFGVPAVNLSYAYQSSTVSSDINGGNLALPNQADIFGVQEGYGLVNARASLNHIGGRNLDLSIWARNLLGKDYYISKINGGAIGYIAGTLGEPRTFGVNLTYSF